MKPGKALELYGELNRLGALSAIMKRHFLTFPFYREMFNEDVGVRLCARWAAGEAFVKFGKSLKEVREDGT